MIKTEKKHLTLNIDSEIAQRAVDDPNIKVSELTEKFLHAHILTTEIEDKKKIYQGYRELFNLMLPLLQKFKVRTRVAYAISERDPGEPVDFDPNGEPIYEEVPPEIFETYLEPDGSLDHSAAGHIDITELVTGEFLKTQDIIDEFLESIQEGAEYRKKPFKQIEIAKTIIDAITKGVIPKSEGKGGKRK